MNQLIFRFRPIYKSTLWGGNRIAPYKNEKIDLRNIGESWEISAVSGNETEVADGEDKGITLSSLCRKYGDRLLGSACVSRYGNIFPLLIKIIDACKDLSVQVHPDDRLAAKRHGNMGKTEMWYIVSPEKDAKIYCGFRYALPPSDLEAAVREGHFKDYLGSYISEPGDFFFIPAGRVHSIGSGNLLIEIQQSSDVTYRIDDFNRRDADGNLRKLHIDLAKDAIDYSVSDSCRNHVDVPPGNIAPLVECRYFTTDVLRLGNEDSVLLPAVDSFRVVICVRGRITVEADGRDRMVLQQGHSALIAASAKKVSLYTSGIPSEVLLSNI